MRLVFVGGIVPTEIVNSLSEVDVVLVEDGGPLERRLDLRQYV